MPRATPAYPVQQYESLRPLHYGWQADYASARIIVYEISPLSHPQSEKPADPP